MEIADSRSKAGCGFARDAGAISQREVAPALLPFVQTASKVQIDYGKNGILCGSDLPLPPTMHWLLVALFSCLTFGLFSVIWPMVQASWVKKVDRESSATVLLAIAAACYVLGWIMSPVLFLSLLAFIAQWVLVIIAFFQMAHATQRVCKETGAEIDVNPITLFVFGQLYFQGILGWVGRFKNTGRTHPSPPDGIFGCFLFLQSLHAGCFSFSGLHR